MKNLVFIVFITLSFIACQQEETVITPTFKESVEFSVEDPDFIVEDEIPAENIKSVAGNVDFNGVVTLNDIWLEVKTNKNNSANIAVVNLTIKDGDSDVQLLDEDLLVSLEDEASIVPLLRVLSDAGRSELVKKINNIVAGTDNSNIELSLKGETFYSSGMTGTVDVDMEMFIRYSF